MMLEFRKDKIGKNINMEESIVPILSSGGIGILPTDTLYGVVGSALNEKTVERIYDLRKRDSDKPMIILVSSFDDLDIFGIMLSEKQKNKLSRLWPGKVSVILKCRSEKFSYLHKGGGTLAFRMPNDYFLNCILKKTGPLVAPSANVEGFAPAEKLEEAKKYFKDDVDFYVDAGTLESKPSTLVCLDEGGCLEILRQGAAQIDP